MKKIKLHHWALVVSLATPLTSQAAFIEMLSTSADAGKCSTAAHVKLDEIIKDGDATGSNVNSYASTTCGLYDGNDSNILALVDNIGVRNDGFMNMDADTVEDQYKGPSPTSVYSYTDFLRESDLQVLGPDSHNADPLAMNDPGWLYLGKQDGSDANPFEYGSVNGTSLGNVNGKSLFDVSVTGINDTTGTWSLSVNANAIADTTALLGRLTTFDHLAIVIKTASSFAIYDFNFNDIFMKESDDGNNVFNFLTPYTFTGTFATNDFLNPTGKNFQDVSHISFWARDPIISTDVSEPSILVMFISVAGFFAFRRRK